MAAKSELKQQMETQQMERGGLGGVCMHIFVCGHMGIYTLNVLSMYKNQHTLLCICVYIYIHTQICSCILSCMKIWEFRLVQWIRFITDMLPNQNYQFDSPVNEFISTLAKGAHHREICWFPNRVAAYTKMQKCKR